MDKIMARFWLRNYSLLTYSDEHFEDLRLVLECLYDVETRHDLEDLYCNLLRTMEIVKSFMYKLNDIYLKDC